MVKNLFMFILLKFLVVIKSAAKLMKNRETEMTKRENNRSKRQNILQNGKKVIIAPFLMDFDGVGI